MYTEITITYYKDSDNFHQIVLIKDGIYVYIEPFDLKHHAEYLNLDITTFKEI
jgi:hypothetical protein